MLKETDEPRRCNAEVHDADRCFSRRKIICRVGPVTGHTWQSGAWN